MLGTSGGICISESNNKRAAGKSSFRQRHIGASKVYNDEEDDNQDENLNGVLPLLRSSANSRRRSANAVEWRPVTAKENDHIDNGGYERQCEPRTCRSREDSYLRQS